MSNNQEISGVFNFSGQEATIFVETAFIEVTTNCQIDIINIKKPFSLQRGTTNISIKKLKSNILVFKSSKKQNLPCSIRIKPLP
jgi:hypothetical protein